MPRVHDGCERCGRPVRHGKVCRSCEAQVRRALLHARRLAVGHAGLGFRGTVRDLRARVLPELRRAGMRGLTLTGAARQVQRSLNALMASERGRVA